ncbi:hypothetical protein D3C86_1810080 [compost metagenome]
MAEIVRILVRPHKSDIADVHFQSVVCRDAYRFDLIHPVADSVISDDEGLADQIRRSSCKAWRIKDDFIVRRQHFCKINHRAGNGSFLTGKSFIIPLQIGAIMKVGIDLTV